jgi:hypothetical protein
MPKTLRTSEKLQKQLLHAVSAAVMSMCNEHVPDHTQGPPETWQEDQKKIWDLLNELDHRARRNISAVIVRARRMPFDPHADTMDEGTHPI